MRLLLAPPRPRYCNKFWRRHRVSTHLPLFAFARSLVGRSMSCGSSLRSLSNFLCISSIPAAWLISFHPATNAGSRLVFGAQSTNLLKTLTYRAFTRLRSRAIRAFTESYAANAIVLCASSPRSCTMRAMGEPNSMLTLYASLRVCMVAGSSSGRCTACEQS